MRPGEFVGDVSPTEAWQDLQARAETVLLDVRTGPEWGFVGVPDLSALQKPVLQIEWLMFPAMQINPRFMEELHAEGILPPRPVYLICRSGARSRQAAELLAAHGYITYNIADGFEGQLDEAGHRGVGGWKSARLPWRQT